MNKFYCLHEYLYPGIQERIDSLKHACKKNAVEFIAVDSLTYDHSRLTIPDGDDYLYNIARGSKYLETLLINPEVNTFYRKNPTYISPDSIKFPIVHEKSGIPVPKTIYHATNNKELLKEYVNALGGFPIVVKTSGGTLGVGVIFANDYNVLFSLTDYLFASRVKFMLREYITPKEVARLIVVGDRVVASNQKFIPENDFRTSIKDQLPVPKIYNDEIQGIAVAASHLINFENTGVDIIIDNSDKPYVLEVNMPHDFTTTEKVTKIDIAKIMIEHLKNKAHVKGTL